MTVLLTMPHARVPSWPKTEQPQGERHLPIALAMLDAFATDAHVSAYYSGDVERRLSRDAVGKAPILMVAWLADVDGPEHAATDEWWGGERAKLDRLLADHPGGFIYRTRGGYRIAYLLAEPIAITCDTDTGKSGAWSTLAATWIAYLRRRYQIEADPACCDWQRLYRVPRATREPGGQPENRETIGDARKVGRWPLRVEPGDVEAVRQARPKRRREPSSGVPVGDGVLFYVMRARGWVGRELGPGKHVVACPFASSHTSGEDFDGSTVLYGPGHGEQLGHVHCSHAHCSGRTIRELLGLFSPGELEAARAAAGVS